MRGGVAIRHPTSCAGQPAANSKPDSGLAVKLPRISQLQCDAPASIQPITIELKTQGSVNGLHAGLCVAHTAPSLSDGLQPLPTASLSCNDPQTFATSLTRILLCSSQQTINYTAKHLRQGRAQAALGSSTSNGLQQYQNT